MRALLIACVALLLLPSSAPAQDASSGAVTGSVASQNHILLEGADVTLEGFGSAQTDSQGRFTFARVSPGNYRLSVAKSGFTPATRAVSVRAGYTAQIDVVLGGFAQAPRSPGDSVSVPLLRGGNAFLVRAQINGRIDAIFLLDTGASVTTISTRVARELGINTGFGSPTTEISTASGILRVPLATLDSIQVGGAEARDVRVVVLDLPKGPQLTGLLGNTFLSRFRVQLDAANAVLTLTSP